MPDDIPTAVARIAALKDEHRDLVTQIAADPGMSPETRTALLTHIAHEEDEAVAALVDATGATARGRLTVGSLRTPRAGGWTTAGTVGTFRRD